MVSQSAFDHCLIGCLGFLRCCAFIIESTMIMSWSAMPGTVLHDLSSPGLLVAYRSSTAFCWVHSSQIWLECPWSMINLQPESMQSVTSQNNVPEMTSHSLSIELALAADGLWTRRLNSITFSDLPLLTSTTLLNGGATAWLQKTTCTHFEFWNDQSESKFTMTDGWITNYDQWQAKN